MTSTSKKVLSKEEVEKLYCQWLELTKLQQVAQMPAGFDQLFLTVAKKFQQEGSRNLIDVDPVRHGAGTELADAISASRAGGSLRSTVRGGSQYSWSNFENKGAGTNAHSSGRGIKYSCRKSNDDENKVKSSQVIGDAFKGTFGDGMKGKISDGVKGKRERTETSESGELMSGDDDTESAERGLGTGKIVAVTKVKVQVQAPKVEVQGSKVTEGKVRRERS